MSEIASQSNPDNKDEEVWIEMSSSRDVSVASAEASGSGHSALQLESSGSDMESSGARHNSILTLESMRQIIASSFSSLTGQQGTAGPVSCKAGSSRTPKWHRSARFALRCFVHFANLVLRVGALVIFYEAEPERGIIKMQCGLELVGIVISLHVCCQDADVQRWIGAVRAVSTLLYVPSALIIYTIFGVCQVIHLKRAWARQLNVANVIATLDEKDFLWTGPGLGAEHALPIALLTGVPFALVSLYGFLTLEHADLQTYILGFATLSALLVVSMAVVEVDVAVSSYVAKRYHFDPSRSGRTAGRLQCVYPVFHILFRTAEVLMRISYLMVFMVLMVEYSKATTLGEIGGKCISLLLICVDFLVSVVILLKYSPKSEGFFVHVFAAVGLVLANVVFFVDMPGFCRPARLVSHCLEGWRIVQLIAFLVFVFVAQDASMWDPKVPKVSKEFRLYQGYWLILISSIVHALLRFSPLALKKGDDLHTAVLGKKLERLKKLLEAGSGGEMLDVDGPMKDRRQATPAMLAAGMGNLEALELLMGSGARVHSRNAWNETVLHYAVKYSQPDALQFLVTQRGARTVLRHDLPKLRQLAEQSASKGDKSRLLRLLLEPSSHRQSTSLVPSNQLASVRPENARGRHLGSLFPDAVQEEIPPCSQLHSVSSLVVVHAVGKLSRLVLPTPNAEEDQPSRRGSISSQAVNFGGDGSAVKLESLRKVRKLGQGAFGAVIEVEVADIPSDNHSLSMSNFGSFKRFIGGDTALLKHSFTGPTTPSADQPKRFAMKLQAKTQSNVQWQACSELLALKRAIHPFIVKLEQAFQTPQCYALLLEFCPGGDVNRLLLKTEAADGRCLGLPVDSCARYVGQVLLALAHLHEALGIVYRDVKPENILISTKDVAKLADFGSALYVGKAQRAHLSAVGTKGFLAPELVFGVEDDDDEDSDKVNPFKTDAYSLGVTLEVMLLGEDSCDIIEDEGGEKWMVPNTGDENNRKEMLDSQLENGRLPREAHELLLKLSPHRPDARHCLADPIVKNHAFFLKTLVCKDLAECLMPKVPHSEMKSALSAPTLQVLTGQEMSAKDSWPSHWR